MQILSGALITRACTRIVGVIIHRPAMLSVAVVNFDALPTAIVNVMADNPPQSAASLIFPASQILGQKAAKVR